MFGKLLLCAALAVSASGCAAQSYGRLQSVSLAEAQTLRCEDIDAELVRIEGFRHALGEAPAWWAASARLADAAAGNDQERQAARRSADARHAQLLIVREKLACDAALRVADGI